MFCSREVVLDPKIVICHVLLDNDFTHAELTVNAQVIQEHEHYEDIVESPKGTTAT